MARDGTGPSQGGGGSRWADDVRVAAAFLTRLPLAPPPGTGLASLAGAARAFPFVGLGIGLAAGLVYGLAAKLGLPPWPGAVLAVAAQVVLTGALHEDALADVADGFGGGAGREAKLEIMRDSRIGAYGVAALVLVLVARIAALAALAGAGPVLLALLGAGAASRAAVVGVMHWLIPARADGLGAGAGRPDRTGTMTAGAIALVVAVLVLGPAAGVVALLAAAAGAALVAALARRQIGGQTGDVLGATQQIAEICFLLAAVALAQG